MSMIINERVRGAFLRGALVLVAFGGLTLLLTPVSRAEVVFSNSFNSCGLGSWDGVLGNASYSSTGCQDSACCGKQVIGQGQGQASAFWWEVLNSTNPEEIQVKGWWKFPTNFVFGSEGGPFLKGIILETSTKINRLFINFNTHSPSSASVQALVEGPNAAWFTYNQGGAEPKLHPDGLWRSVEVHWTRKVGVSAGRVKVWLDGNLHIDSAITTCNGSCPAINELKVGAYQNWTASQTQEFYVDNVTLSVGPAVPVGDGSSTAQCGDGIKNGSEVCDGSALAGATCSGLGYGSGTLTCNPNCTGYDTSGCVPLTSGTCAQPGSGWILCDDFESGTLNYWADDLNTQGGKLAVSSQSPLDGQYAARMTHSPGVSDTWGARFFGDHPLKANPGAKIEDLYVKLAVRFSNPQALSSDSTKIVINAAFQAWNAGFPGPNSWSPFYTTLFAETNGQIKMETHSKTSGASVWRSFPQNQGSPVAVQANQWHTIQYHLKLNALNTSNGILEYWIDGAKKAVYTDVNFRDGYGLRAWNHLMLSAHQDPVSSSHTEDWDVIVGSTNFISEGSGEGAPLPPVDGVIRTDVTD